jgi:scyllo-inositol 2-dehydrogenase (NADP+)
MQSQAATVAAGNPRQPSKTLRAGIIGAGRMGITHLAILGGHPAVKVAAISDDSALMNRVLKKFRPDIQLFNDFRKMFGESRLDMVVIATPPHLHASMIEASLDAGLSIFVEKPFTLGAEDARRLSARSGELHGTFQVGYVNRFNDIFMKVKCLLDDGLLGRLISFRSDMFGRTVTRPTSGSGWRGKRETGGGCLYEFGSHAIDLMVYLLGKPARVTGTCLTPIYSSDADDMVRTNVVYDSGLTGSISVNWSDESYRKPTNKIEILGESGKILADQHELKLYLQRAVPPYSAGWSTLYITDTFTPVPFYVRGNEFTRQLFHFAERVQDPSQPNLSGFPDATVTQEVIDMILADAGMVN